MRSKIAALLVDGSNMYAALRELGFGVDWKKMLSAFPDDIHKAYYFTALPPDTEQSTLRPMVDWMMYNKWNVIHKVTKEFVNADTGETKIKGNMDIEMATIAFELAPFCHTIYLVSGDGDFRFMVEALQRRYGIKVVVVSTIACTPPMCADDLRRQADDFIDLSQLRDKIARDRDAVAFRRNKFLGG